MPTRRENVMKLVDDLLELKMSRDFKNDFPRGVLIFVNRFGRKIPLRKRKSLDDMLRQFFDLTQQYPSHYKTTRERQCRSGAFRSAWDIWRHIVDVMPEVTLFDVMGALSRLTPELRTQYCSVVKKRVFYHANWTQNNPLLLGANVIDEFGLRYDEWKVFA